MSVPFIRLIESSNLQQVCKDPQKTNEKKAVLVSQDVVNTKRIQLTKVFGWRKREVPLLQYLVEYTQNFSPLPRSPRNPLRDVDLTPL